MDLCELVGDSVGDVRARRCSGISAWGHWLVSMAVSSLEDGNNVSAMGDIPRITPSLKVTAMLQDHQVGKS